MGPNWFKINLRILFKYRLYTVINLAGLSIAISSFWFIANFVNYSHRYDSFHQNSKDIYRITMEVTEEVALIIMLQQVSH
jgi:putative ABC transport system permease protein